MRRLSICAVCLAVVVGLVAIRQVAGADLSEPTCTKAQITTAGAAVRSGPAESYYQTGTLAVGETVEIYQRRPDGWCAIRPPESSFSWVFARHVVPLGDGLGRIDKDGVPARIGSNLTGQRDVTQVLLDEGEIVRVIDEQTHDGETWFKIAPPAGEFRWIHAGSIRSDAEQANIQTEIPTAPITEWRPVAKSNRQMADMTTDNENQGVMLASTELDAVAAEGSAAPVAAASGQIDRQVADLELRLSRMVIEPTGTWDVGQMERDAEQLLSQSQTVADRDAVQATLTKIDRFASIHRRYAQTGGITSVAAQNPTTGAGGTASSGTGTASPSEAGRYDAVGILRPVVSRRPGAPQFALVDERGQVVSFVTPSPDVNLQPYLGRRVGVVGSRGFMPEFRRNHVVAGRISPLETTMVR